MKLQLTLQIPKEVRERLEEVSEGANSDTTKFAAQVLGEISKLKPEYALRWIQHIPLEYYRRGPGRPQSPKEHELHSIS